MTSALITNPTNLDFVSANIQAVRVACSMAGGELEAPIALLSNASTQAVFTPAEAETNAEFEDRLRTEARAMRAEHLFIAVPTMVGSVLVDLLPVGADTSPTGACAQARELESMSAGIFWYAKTSGKSARLGMMRKEAFKVIPSTGPALDLGVQLGECWESEAEQPFRYDDILEG